jgi:hypothetical protein
MTFVNDEIFNCCSFSPREKVRMRGNAVLIFTLSAL